MKRDDLADLGKELVSRLLNSYTVADGACEARSRSDEEADALSSTTNRDDEIDRNPHRPFGLRRSRPVFVVAPRARLKSIASSYLPASRGVVLRSKVLVIR